MRTNHMSAADIGTGQLAQNLTDNSAQCAKAENGRSVYYRKEGQNFATRLIRTSWGISLAQLFHAYGTFLRRQRTNKPSFGDMISLKHFH